MEPKPYTGKPNVRIVQTAPSLKWIERLAHLMDSRFLIPGTKIRFGIDPLIGLFPVFGDVLAFLISGMLIYTMHTHGASRKVVIKMIINSTVDTVFGSIPVVGNIFDFFYRANDRNVRLLKEHYFEGKHHGSGTGLLVVVIVIALAIVALVSYGVVKLLQALMA